MSLVFKFIQNKKPTIWWVFCFCDVSWTYLVGLHIGQNRNAPPKFLPLVLLHKKTS